MHQAKLRGHFRWSAEDQGSEGSVDSKDQHTGFTEEQAIIRNWARSHVWHPGNVTEAEFKSSGLM